MVANISETKRLGHYFEYLEDLISKAIHIPKGGNVQYWRDRLFSSIFYPIIIVGFLVYVPGIFLCIKLSKWDLAIIDTVVYLTAITVTVFRIIPFKIRAVAGGLAFYIMGFFLLIVMGPTGFGQIWLFSFPVLMGLFLSTRQSLYALLLNAMALIITGVMMHKNMVYWQLSPDLSIEIWIVNSLTFLFLNTIVTLSLAILFQGLQKSLAKEESMTEKLNQEHNVLLETNEHLKREIHERELAEKEKANLQKQLQQAQKMESIGTLAGGIAHDFNNILYPIIGFTELTLFEVPEDSLAQKNLQEIHIAAKRAKDLVQQILRFSRMETPGFKPIKMQEIIQELLSLLRASIPTTIDINLDIDDQCGPISGDPTQIHQLIINLCTNAFQAMEKTGGSLELILREHDRISDNFIKERNLAHNQYVVLTIQDNGPGITPAVMERMFDPYYTTKEQGKGTGLGLSVVHGIVKSHGGDICVESTPGKGARFQVYLPLVREDIETEVFQPDTVIANGTERILVVDDEEQILAMVKQMLSRFGYHVETCNSSREALNLFRFNPHKFDLIITDMTMPKMTGFELSKKIKSIKPLIPIILCTGFSEGITKEELKTAGIDGLIMKPVVRKDLVKMIRDILDNNDLDVSGTREKAAG